MASTAASATSTAQVQQELEEVKVIMQDNLNKAIERGENLQDLQLKTEELQESSQQFQKTAKEVKRQMWWKDTKMQIIIGVVVVCVLALIIGLSVGLSKK
ncbi:synaptobrevin [Hyaloraphidium curvatum]|nr:synaptobrevin [Hyaloraphidium curvatum]